MSTPVKLKPIEPWVTSSLDAVTVATRHEKIADSCDRESCAGVQRSAGSCEHMQKLVASIRPAKKPHSSEFASGVFVALIHVSYASMPKIEREHAEFGQPIPLPEPPHTLDRIKQVTDKWLREILFDA